jgi:hypothetical protein
MPISGRMAAAIMSGFLLLTTVPAFARSHDLRNHQRGTNRAAITCVPLSWEASNKLPWFIKASDVYCMSPTENDLQASAEARNLLETAVTHMRTHQSTSGSSTEIEYNDGIAAYAEGRYIAAIDHFRAAVPANRR